MTAVTSVILEHKKIKSVTVSSFSPFICHQVMRGDAMIFIFLMLSFKPAFSLFSVTFIKRLFSSSSLSARSAYLRPLIFLQADWFQLVPHPAQHFMMYSAYKLNKQGDNIQPCHNSFPDFELFSCSMSVSNCCFLTYIQVSQETGKVWYSPSF